MAYLLNSGSLHRETKSCWRVINMAKTIGERREELHDMSTTKLLRILRVALHEGARREGIISDIINHEVGRGAVIVVEGR